MNNASTALKVSAGIFLTIALITIVVVLFISAQEATKSAQNNFADIQTEMSQAAFTVYDNTTVSGSQVLNALRKFQDKGEFGVQVETGKSLVGSWYFENVETTVAEGTIGYGSITNGASSDNITNASNESSPDYINPSGKFLAKVIKDKSDVIRAITFEQK
ncbi:ABC transporter permease [Paenibacillus crassostreae]|uniref:ABC transporter permease n=1 Tax=Paenibacillus crassostreae TaxID=1763538 RepID=A0A167DSP7_9BACL|nr:ABC transporter permease [Paenibacillus crassostreae]AOZ91105.1 ABC transporter permease [Paenibacillus crassostreae]OAB74735.1 ABC transporter permease [Paenibacillus crassostreae]